MTPRRRTLGPTLLAVIGILVMLIGLGLHWWNPAEHRLEWIPQIVGASIAFAGFYGMDPTRAKDGGGFLVSAGTKIIAQIRTGDRATDPVVTVTKAEVPAPLAPNSLELPPEILPLAKIPASEKGP